MKTETVTELILAISEALTIFDDNPNLYETHGGTWERLTNALIDALNETKTAKG
jgi:hypothetical protein